MSLLDVAVIAMIIAGLAAFGATLKWLFLAAAGA
jgi:hypothetical protein